MDEKVAFSIFKYRINVFRNDYFIVSNNAYLAMGGGGNGSAFRIDDELHYGSCNVSATFDNKMLSFTDHFRCTRFEIWTFE